MLCKTLEGVVDKQLADETSSNVASFRSCAGVLCVEVPAEEAASSNEAVSTINICLDCWAWKRAPGKSKKRVQSAIGARLPSRCHVRLLLWNMQSRCLWSIGESPAKGPPAHRPDANLGFRRGLVL